MPEAFVEQAFRLVQHAEQPLKQTAQEHGRSLLMAVTRLGGGFCLLDPDEEDPANHDRTGDEDASVEPLTAALAGLVKSAHHEWPEVACKVVDLGGGFEGKPNKPAAKLFDEALLDGPLEVGIAPQGRRCVELIQTALPAEARPKLPREGVVVISGGARGVTAEVAVALAEAWPGTLLLLGRSAPPEPEPDWLAPLTDEAAIKRELIQRAEGEQRRPQAIEAACRRALANREALRTLRRISQAGAVALYEQADVRDGESVASAVSRARAAHGPILGLIHGAGVLADRLLGQKTPEQIDAVFGTKVEGLETLLRASGMDPLRFVVGFSSSTARFGRKGQSDYAAGNEVVNKRLAELGRARGSGCRVLSVNWGPWDGGMVTPSLKRLFEAEGVGVIPLADGARWLVRTLAQPGRDTEIVVLGPGSDVEAQRATAPTAAEQPGPAPESAAEPELKAKAEPISTPSAGPPAEASMTLAFERRVSLSDHPFLRDHALAGRAVLPIAIVLEWLTHAAMHENPGQSLVGVEALEILQGIKLGPGDAVGLRALAGGVEPINGDQNLDRVATELRRQDGTLHARSRVLLGGFSTPNGSQPLDEVPTEPPAGLRPWRGAIYGPGGLFHGPGFQVISGVAGCSESGILVQARPAPSPSGWMQRPMRSGWLTEPGLIDAALQAGILWTLQELGVPSLPMGIGAYRQRKNRPSGPATIRATFRRPSEHAVEMDAVLISQAEPAHVMAQLSGCRFTLDASLTEAFARNRLPEAVG
jgi:NAD(P)-dependent dehydrogenase (short-subunit alcohol dehydrogenase family)